MKRYLFFILALALLLCGCTPSPAETEPPTTQTVPESTAPKVQWVPYDGNSKNYTYLHTSDRDKAWEEDILFFGDSYLSEYPLLTHFPSRIDYGIEKEYSDEFYDPAMRQTFLDEINKLIPMIPELSDSEILYGLQRILALLGDAHTCLTFEWEVAYPIGFQEFWEDGMPVYYVTLVPEEYEHAILCTLAGINGIALDEVIERLAPYIPTENQYYLHHTLSGGSQIGRLANRDLLAAAGIVKGDTIVYNLLTDYGLPFNLKLNSYTVEEAQEIEYVGHTHPGAYPHIYGEEDTAYFYTWMENSTMMYVRVNEYEQMQDYTFFQLGNDVIRELRDAGGAEKLVLDLRRNPGGYQFYGYTEFITALARMEYDSLYVLIDEGTFSGGILMAGQIKQQFPEAILVGTPAGQPPNFFAGMNEIDYILPNSGAVCRMPTAFFRVLPDYAYDALMPDITVYPTIQDYIYCIDTILDAVKAQ